MGCYCTHGRFNCIHQVAPVWPPSNTCFIGPTEDHIPNSISIGSAVFCTVHGRESLYFTIWATPFPSILPLCMGRDLGPHLTHGSLGPTESKTQMAYWSVQPFLQGSRSQQTVRWTDQATPSVTIGHSYVRSTAMQPNNTTVKLYIEI